MIAAIACIIACAAAAFLIAYVDTLGGSVCAKNPMPVRKAWKLAKKMQKNGDEVHAYHCAECACYHVGYDRINKTGRRRKEANV